MAGSAKLVYSATALALRNHLDSPARAAKFGVQRRVDAAVGVEQGDERQLVEDDDDDRGRGAEGDVER